MWRGTVRTLLRRRLPFVHCNRFRSMATTTQSPAATVSMAELISASIDLAHHAGKRIKEIYQSGHLGAVDKSNPNTAPSDTNQATSDAPFGTIDDPQTLADIAAQKVILGSLARAFPGLRLVGEEGDVPASATDLVTPSLQLVDGGRFPEQLRSVPLSSVTVYIDPLDGTKEFTLGHTEGVTLLIGFTIDDRAVAGVIGQPFTGNVVWGAVGVGVEGVKHHDVHNYHDQDPASSMLDTTTPSTPLPASAPTSRIIVTTRSHFTPVLSSLLTRLQPTALVRSGGAGSKTLLLLSRQVDCYYFPSFGLKWWDVVACQAVVEAAGGRVTDAWGGDLRWVEAAGRKDGYQVRGGMIGTMAHHDFYLVPRGTSITDSGSRGNAKI